VQWSQIKTVFIICFLILNIFLVYQLINRQGEEITYIMEPSREEELEFNINGLRDLSDDIFTAPLLYAQNYNYNQEATEDLAKLQSQKTVIVDDYYLYSRFDEPIPLNSKGFEEVIAENIYKGNDYVYWGEIDSARVLVFFQQVEQPIFFNQNAVMYIHLNAEGAMTQYVQTRLSQAGEREEERSLIQQYDAVYRLYHNSNVLQTDDTITGARLGYHNIVSLPNGEQLLNPTWDIEVNDEDHHFINALEGHIYSQNEDFFQENIATFIELLEDASDDELEFYQLDDDQDELISILRQALVGVYKNIVEVDSE